MLKVNKQYLSYEELIEAYDIGTKAATDEQFVAGLRNVIAEHEAKKASRSGEPLFLLTCGAIDSDGYQQEWDVEANSGKAIDAFARSHPGETIGLYAAPGIASNEANKLRSLALMYLNWLGVSNPSEALEKDLRDPQMVEITPATRAVAKDAWCAGMDDAAAICDARVFALDYGGNQYRREATASQCATAIRAARKASNHIGDATEKVTQELAAAKAQIDRLRNTLELIASPMRPDGTWNRDRMACQQLAERALANYVEELIAIGRQGCCDV